MTKLYNEFLEKVVALRRQDPLFGDVFEAIYKVFKGQQDNYESLAHMMRFLILSNACIFIVLVLERGPK